MAAGQPLVQVRAEHDVHEGHSHTSTGEWLAMGLWSGLALVLIAALVLGLVVGARVLRRQAAARVPCANCGTFLDPARDRVCPTCGLPLNDRA